MDPNPRLRHEHREQVSATVDLSVSSQHQSREFATPEDLLRHDRAATPLPATIAQRLESSLQEASAVPTQNKPWWKRWLGGSGE